jgi:hypothetical protein
MRLFSHPDMDTVRLIHSFEAPELAALHAHLGRAERASDIEAAEEQDFACPLQKEPQMMRWRSAY